ncbi:hypothetical protein KGA66_03270 [Actinocrinis puniceicyclus]|uniref:HEAT repeat protein n=2 Tax=Actinocrinis puniceicyclus TaxID=977794 RepID=A0A8J7WLP4_9ACTN|nr:hypothetical protein [Actinocrinis puniceicyclus]
MTSAADRPAVAQPIPDLPSLIAAARSGSADDVDRLGAVLVECALSGTQDAGVLLAALAREPALLLRLDGIARHRDYYGYLPVRRGAWVDQACARFDAAGGCLDPVVLAVASLAADGWVRERAVAAMGVRPVPELMPFLVLRTADWAGPVRERACAALALALHWDPGYVGFAGPMAARLVGRTRADFALSQVNAVLSRLTDEQFTRLLAGPQPLLRRVVAAQAGRFRLPELVHLALAESDPRTRDLLAETAAREALWSGRHEFLHRLAAARSADVRAIALAGLLRAGLADQVTEHLADPSPMVRATARFAARTAGIDVLERYRALLRGGRVEPGAVLGLAEAAVNGNAGADMARDLVEPFVADGVPQVRAAAVTALRLLGVPTLALIAPLLADPVPVVVRAAVAAVESAGLQVESAQLLALLGDPARPAGARRALYRLCRRQHSALRVAGALVAAAADDPKLVTWATGDLREMAVPGGWPRRPSTLRVDLAGQDLVPDLETRIQQARPVLPPDVYNVLAAAVA